MHLTYKQIQSIILPVSLDNWLSTLQKSIPERSLFQVSGDTIHIGQVIVRFLGVPIDEDEYYNHLFELIHLNDVGLILLTKEILEIHSNNKPIPSIHKILQIDQKENLTFQRLVEYLDRENLLLKTENQAFHRKIKEAFLKMVTHFATLEKADCQSEAFQTFLQDIIFWSFHHLNKHVQRVDPLHSMPKFLWYGDFHKNHRYFIYFLMEIGCDLIIFSPSGEDILSFVDPNGKGTPVIKFPNSKKPDPFPTEKRSRKATVAYRAAKEIETIMSKDGLLVYKSWQLRDHIPHSITLKTTYDEIFLIGKEKAMYRPEFEVTNNIVKIPCIFAKIQGISKNKRDYWDKLHSLWEMEQSLFITQFPFARGINHDIRFHYKKMLGEDGRISVEKMMTSHYWKYSHLPIGLQKGIGNAIKNICAKPSLKPIYNESIEDIKIFLFTHGLQLPGNIIKLLMQFDYSQEVPKLILFNNETNGVITRSDAALLLLLNQIGVDIIVYNPAGGNDIENYMDPSLFDIHWLEEVVFELEWKEPSIVRKCWRQVVLKYLRRLKQ